MRRRVEDELLKKAPSQPAFQEIASNYRDSLALLASVADVKQAMERQVERSIRQEDRNRPIETPEMQRAIGRIRELRRDAAPHVAARARLWSARALLLQGRESEALAELSAVRQQRPFGAEAIVGGLEEIELLARTGRGSEVLGTTRSMMRELGDDRGFDASLISFDEFRRRVLGAIEQLRENGDLRGCDRHGKGAATRFRRD